MLQASEFSLIRFGVELRRKKVSLWAHLSLQYLATVSGYGRYLFYQTTKQMTLGESLSSRLRTMIQNGTTHMTLEFHCLTQ